jgi:hypothetical protein
MKYENAKSGYFIAGNITIKKFNYSFTRQCDGVLASKSLTLM